MGPRIGLDVCEKSRPNRDSIPGTSSPYAVAIPTELPDPHILKYYLILCFNKNFLFFSIILLLCDRDNVVLVVLYTSAPSTSLKKAHYMSRNMLLDMLCKYK
jgi:hypothetical protein